VSSKKDLVTGPTRGFCALQGPADRGHEQPVATAKAGLAHLALEDHQLVAKDHQLDIAVQMIGGGTVA
jgi:hypothetical protein